MAIKYFDINRLVKLPAMNPMFALSESYICFDDIVGVSVRDGNVEMVYTTGGHFGMYPTPLADFEAEVERAIKQTMADQNENLNDFQNELKDKIAELKAEALFNKTDKIISDSN